MATPRLSSEVEIAVARPSHWPVTVAAARATSMETVVGQKFGISYPSLNTIFQQLLAICGGFEGCCVGLGIAQ
jgi:hypothetical protein